MKKEMGIVSVGAALLLGACNGESTANEPELTPEEVAEDWHTYIVDAAEELESYTADMTFTVNTSSAIQADAEDVGGMRASIIGDFDRGYIVTSNRINGDEVEEYIFFDGTDVYYDDGSGWQDVSDDEPMSSESDYHAVIHALAEVEEYLEVATSGEEVELSYAGEFEQAIWDAFESPFSLGLDGFSDDDVELELDSSIDSTTQYVQDLLLVIRAANEIGEIQIIADVEYTEHDEVDVDDVEEEVQEELGE